MKPVLALLAIGVTGCSSISTEVAVLEQMEVRERKTSAVYESLYKDSDQDGVADYWDQCLNTPADIKVSQQGCPMDTNGNGVPDYREYSEQSVQATQSPVTNPISNTLPMIADDLCYSNEGFDFAARCYGFEHDSAVVSREMQEALDEVVDALNAVPNLIALEIVGHTDNSGSAAYNLKLSERRANAIATAIQPALNNGVELLVNGMGEFVPLVSNSNDEERAVNRRVEIYVLQSTN